MGTETSGTILEEYYEKVQLYGFQNIDEARANIVKTNGGTYTIVNRLRLTPSPLVTAPIILSVLVWLFSRQISGLRVTPRYCGMKC